MRFPGEADLSRQMETSPRNPNSAPLHAMVALLAGLAVMQTGLLPRVVFAQHAAAAAPPARIAFISDRANPLMAEIRGLVRAELLGLVRDEFDVLLPEDLVIVADGTATGVANALERLIVNDEVAIIVTQGLLSSELAARGAPWPKPVIASTVFDARLQGYPQRSGASGVANLTYIAYPPPGPVLRDLGKFRELADFSRAAILVDEEAASTFAGFIERLRETSAELGITLEPVSVGATAADALERLPAHAEAAYLGPLNGLDPGELEKLIDGLAARRLPSFSYSAADVNRGVMASLGALDVALVARRIALDAYRILLGDDPAELPVTIVPAENLVVNMRTVRRLGITPPLQALLEARRLFESPEGVERSVTIESVMHEALAANLALAAEQQAVRAGAEDVRLARARRLPALEAGVTGAAVSRRAAESSFGLRPRRNVDGALTLSQLLFSHEANANVSIQESLQASRQWDQTALELDVVLQAAEAYLNVLRGKSLERVQQNNLDLTLASLRLAQERERIGAAGPGERLRLKSELARRRAERINAYAARMAAEMSLNQVLDRPINEPFATPEADLEGRELLQGSLATRYLADLSRVGALDDFLVDAAVARAPEISSVDAVIAAQERRLASTRQAFYLPRVALQGNLADNLLRENAGGAPLPPGLAAPAPADESWQLGLSITLPIFEGNARGARRRQAAAGLSQLRRQRALAAQRIEQNLRVQLLFARASLAIVSETETAAESARQSLDLVTQSYGQGVVSVVDLLEAQTSALASERGVANAVYDYLVNLKRVERAVGQFEALATPEERAGLLQRLAEFERGRERG